MEGVNSYHHGDLRNALTGAAAELAREGGPEAVVLREAARRVGVTPTAAYRHFDGQRDLLGAVKQQAQAVLATTIERALQECGDEADAGRLAIARLRAAGRAYLEFAFSEPGLFNTAFCRDRNAPPDEAFGYTDAGAYILLGVAPKPPYGKPTNDGFVADYERVGRNLDPQRFTGLLSPLVNEHVAKQTAGSAALTGVGPLVMRCQDPKNVPVLSQLALSFAVSTRWFSPVPGETWPNRNFLHAATSDGETDIDTRLYANPTIFELLEAHGSDWNIYHDDTPQVWAFVNLWDTPERHAKWHPFTKFAEHVKAGKLPAYSFIEPNHRPPVHTLDHDPVVGWPDVSDSQHPGNNIVSQAAYESFTDNENTDFTRGETLIAQVYETLRSQPDLFERTLLVITYDEHGGLYDHVAPPQNVPAPGPARPGARLAHLILEKSSTAFDFTMLGPRVPAIVVSPLVAPGTVDGVVRDHTTVPATLRALFAPQAEPLTHRDAWAPSLHGLLTLDQPRQGSELPDLSTFAARITAETKAVDAAAAEASPDKVGEFYRDFLRQAEVVWQHLAKRGEPETAAGLADREPQRAVQISKAFAAAAERHRQQLSN